MGVVDVRVWLRACRTFPCLSSLSVKRACVVDRVDGLGVVEEAIILCRWSSRERNESERV